MGREWGMTCTEATTGGSLLEKRVLSFATFTGKP